MAQLDSGIGRVEQEIATTEDEIKRAEREAQNTEDKDDRTYWRQKELLLRQEKSQLRQRQGKSSLKDWLVLFLTQMSSLRSLVCVYPRMPASSCLNQHEGHKP